MQIYMLHPLVQPHKASYSKKDHFMNLEFHIPFELIHFFLIEKPVQYFVNCLLQLLLPKLPVSATRMRRSLAFTGNGVAIAT